MAMLAWRNWRDKFQSRKWLLVLLVQIPATVALFSGHLDGGQFTQISSVTLAAYNLGNVGEYFGTKKDDSKTVV